MLIAPFIGLLSNWLIRGGGIEPLLNRDNISGLRWVNAAIYGCCFAFATGIYWHALPAFALMAAGQAPKVGTQIKRITEGKFLGVLQITVRGGFWGLCLAVGGLFAQNWLFASLCILAGLTMGLIVWIMYQIFRFDRGNSIFHYWSCSEMLFGFLIWWPLSVL